MDAPATATAPSYTVNEVRTRIGVYIAIASMTAAGSGVLNLVAMTDAQLATMSVLRWALTILSLLISVILAGLNAFRAAIDRSTAGGNETSVSAIAPNPLLK
jgi:hypothetical protein